MIALAVIILTYNEERHISRALACLTGLAREVFVIDSFSTDKTAELARAAGAVVLQNKFVNYARQFEWGLAHAPVTADWIMRLDADEILTAELVEEVCQRLPNLPAEVSGVNLNRYHIFLGRKIRYGGRYPQTMLRIWRRGTGRIEQRWMDEHMVLLSGRAVTFVHDFVDHNLKDLTYFTDKHNGYATREAVDVLKSRRGLGQPDKALTQNGNSPQAAWKRWAKESIYNLLPIWFGPVAYFFYRYVFRLGILDGPEGLIYHALQGFWYRFLVGAKVLELDRAIAAFASIDAQLAELARLTGYDIAELKDHD